MDRISSWCKAFFNWCGSIVIFGWAHLAFGDRLKLVAFIIQTGAGMVMTVMAGYALYSLALMKAVWPVFYLGAGALGLVGIIVTGFGALLYKRNVEFEFLGAKFKAADHEGAAAMAETMKVMSENAPTAGAPPLEPTTERK